MGVLGDLLEVDIWDDEHLEGCDDEPCACQDGTVTWRILVWLRDDEGDRGDPRRLCWELPSLRRLEDRRFGSADDAKAAAVAWFGRNETQAIKALEAATGQAISVSARERLASIISRAITSSSVPLRKLLTLTYHSENASDMDIARAISEAARDPDTAGKKRKAMRGEL